ncbi:MATE family efflux transporter, partial [uncultured Capnocytophaga sp.]|uniref:MATE family efflux transporter n=1 Tax=uncultured Capnocytophaga sp. TaxID=159273 RepID=UPI00262992EC
QPVISYNLGKKNHKNLKDILKISIIFLGVLGIFCSFFISLFSEYIGKIFFREQDMILYVKRVLRIYSLSYVVVGINIFISAYFTAIKKVIYSALITFSPYLFWLFSSFLQEIQYMTAVNKRTIFLIIVNIYKISKKTILFLY